MTGDVASLQADYVELQPDRTDHDAQPAVVALPVPRPLSDRGNVTQGALAELAARRGRRVRALAGARERLHRARRTQQGPGPGTGSNRHARGRAAPAAGGQSGPATSVCCSAASSTSRPTSPATTSRRSRRAASRTCSSAARPSTSVRRSTTLRTALTAIEWPDDGLSVFATLRGPLFAVGRRGAAGVARALPRLPPLHVPADAPEELAAVAAALRTLRDLQPAAQPPAGRRDRDAGCSR